MKWKDVNVGHVFSDGSVVTEKHLSHQYNSYRVTYNNKTIVLSGDHLLQFNISPLCDDAKVEIAQYCVGNVPLKEKLYVNILGTADIQHRKMITDYLLGKHVSGVSVSDISEPHYEFYIFKFDDGTYHEASVNRVQTSWESQRVSDREYWIPVNGLAYLFKKYGILTFSGTTVQNVEFLGKLPCFCVSTSTGKYELNGLVHHNSVAIQNIIYGGIAHRNEVALSLIDPKYTEFSAYKNMKGIVGVANTTEETVEVLRIAKLAMYQRNQILAELKLKNIMDYKPTKKSGLVYVTGRDYREDDIIKVRTNKVESTIPAKDLVELVNTNTHDVIEVCLNDKDWIEVNYNCVDFIYSDEMKMLVTVLDELAEATQKSGIKDQKAKEQDTLKDEIINLVTSITQLGRSSAIHIISATQKPNSTVVPTVLRSNPLALDTLIETSNHVKVSIRDIQVGDKILGTDNQYYDVVDKTPVHIPTKVYSISFTTGNVICSDTHQWTVHTSDNSYSYVTESEDLFRNKDWFIENDIHFGRYEDDIKLLDVSLVEQTECVCITTNSPDNQFLIYTDSGNPIYTHNCGFRAFCGRATETGASLVALDNNLATTIDSTYPGMGIVQSGGKNEFIRYYFSKFEDLEEYYQQRGLDELGYSPIDSEFSGNSQLEDLDGEIEITVNRDKSKYEFEKNSVEIDNREEQDWREV